MADRDSWRYEILPGNTQFPGSSLDTGKEILTLHLHSPMGPAEAQLWSLWLPHHG